MKSIILIILLFLPGLLMGQDHYDLIFSANDQTEKCSECLRLINNKPKEVIWGVDHDSDYNLYFSISSKAFFNKIFNGDQDGIAIDIVNRKRYDCSKEVIEKSDIKGSLQKPIYRDELIKNQVTLDNGTLIMPVGSIPANLRNEDLEFNLLFLKDQYVCQYIRTYSLKTSRWKLLDMGFYFNNKDNPDKDPLQQESSIFQEKTMQFVIPFEKNKSQYDEKDIAPLYDSLRLTDYEIERIFIRAYSSVEGSTERNEQLQHERAQSIVSALQSYQNSPIDTEIHTSENWVEFLDDISDGPYDYLKSLDKQEIKKKLNDQGLIAELELYLKNHRKSIVNIELQKINEYSVRAPHELITLFNESVVDENIDKALEIQNAIFRKIRGKEMHPDDIGKLEIPQRSEYSILLNKNIIFNYLSFEESIFDTYNKLIELNRLMPGNGHIKYNLNVIKLKMWPSVEDIEDPFEFKKSISELGNYGIPEYLLIRMLVNYEIIRSEYYMKHGEYGRKDESLRYIYSVYSKLKLNEDDMLSLAQFFASYNWIEMAINILRKKVSEIGVDEDLLFYFINLTILRERYVKSEDYRKIMMNAYNINPVRFCNMFNSIKNGGITFQLLEDDYLRRYYCENCR